MPTRTSGGEAAIAQAVDSAVQQGAQNLRDELRSEIAGLRQELDTLKDRPAYDTSIFAPGAFAGGPSRTSEGYSVLRAAAVATGRLEPSAAKYEVDVHRRLEAELVDRGGMQRQGGRGSMLIPIGGRHLAGVDPSLAAEVRQSFAAGVAGCDPDELRYVAGRTGGPVRQALSSYDDAGMGVFVGGGAQGELIELLRSQEVVSRLGAREITLPPSGRLPFPRQTGATTAVWLGEGQRIEESEPTTGAASLVAKKLATLVRMPNELIRFSSPAMEAFVRFDMARSMALAADLAFLTGRGGSNVPLGILNTPGVQYLPAGTLGANGDQIEPRDLTRAITAVEEADVPADRFGWALRPALWGSILERRASAVASGDGEGQYLFPADRGSAAAGRPAALRGYRAETSTQVPTDRAKGSATDLTCLIGGAWDQLVIGRAGVVELAASDEAEDAFTRDQTLLRAIQHVDSLVRHPEAFVVIDQIDPDLPAA